jgi:hypothetical protein
MPTEVELKLAIAPEDVPRLARSPQLKSASVGRAVTTNLYSIYYDTPEGALRDQGAALRLRRAGSRWMQTLKTDGRVEGGLHQREEIETPLPAQILNYTVLAKSGAVPILADPQLPLKLQPVFVTQFKRTTRQLEPVAVIGIDDDWYLMAYCRLRKDFRSFRFDRIAAATTTGECAADRRCHRRGSRHGRRTVRPGAAARHEQALPGFGCNDFPSLHGPALRRGGSNSDLFRPRA